MKKLMIQFILPVTCILLSLSSFTSSNGRDKILNVPYKVQPNRNTCQSTCLKMLAMYHGIPAQNKSIESIYDEVNNDPNRPNHGPYSNYWDNINWWWNENSLSTSMKVHKTKDEGEAIDYLIKSIDNNIPVIMSVSNSNTNGHLILVVGYKSFTPNQSNNDFRLVCHDPYGEFFPKFQSSLTRERRHDFGMSLPNGSEKGVGKGVEIDINNLRRLKSTDDFKGYFVMFGSPVI